MSARVVRETVFVGAARGDRFCLVTRPAADTGLRGGILLAPPFAEELNKSRRMLTLAAQEFAANGWIVLQLDLLGCGDSTGDFGDASWDDWIADLDLSWQLLQERLPRKLPCVLWSLRAGALLVADWLQRSEIQTPWLMWQPTINGKQHLTQFLRLKAANEMLNDADARSAMRRIRSQLAAGESVEIAGYTIAPAVAQGLDASLLRLPDGYAAPILLLEASTAEQSSVSPATAMAAEKWRATGVEIATEAVFGPAFWQTQEIEAAPALLAPSLRFLSGAGM